MRKSILILLLVCSSILSAEAAKKKKNVAKTASKTELKTPLDSASYAIGMEIGNDLSSNFKNLPGGPYNTDLILEALTRMFNADTTNLPIKLADARNTYQTYMKQAEELQVKKTIAENQAFLENNKKNPSVVTTNSGLQYEVIKEGTQGTAKPKATDKVKVNYKGTLLDGTVFDSSYERNAPIEFNLNQVIPGWTEGLQLMPIGSTYKFYIPSELAYGARATGKIKSNSLLIFEVELLDITTPASVEPVTDPNKVNAGKFQFDKYERKNK